MTTGLVVFLNLLKVSKHKVSGGTLCKPYVLTSLSALCWLGGAFSVKGPRRHVFCSLSLSGLSQTYQLSVFKYNEMDFKSNRMRWFHKSKKRSRAKHDRAVSRAGSGDDLTAGVFTYLHMQNPFPIVSKKSLGHDMLVEIINVMSKCNNLVMQRSLH